MTEKEINSDWIDRYNEGDLDEREMAILHGLMRTNPALRSEINIDAGLNQFLADKEMIDLMHKISIVAHKHSRQKPLLKTMLIAATLLCLLLLGGILYMIPADHDHVVKQMHHRGKQDIIAGKEKKQVVTYWQRFTRNTDGAFVPPYSATHHMLLSQNFEPIPEFESLIGAATRSCPVLLNSPEITLTVHSGDSVIFRWESPCTLNMVSIILMDNKGGRVARLRLNPAGSYVLNTRDFASGLYYWKFLVDDDLVIMGKISIL